MSDSGEDSQEEDRLKALMKTATGYEDVSEARNSPSTRIERDSQALSSARTFLEDMEDENGDEVAANEGDIVIPNQKEDAKLNSVFIGGPEPKPPSRRKVLHSQMAQSLASSLGSSRSKKAGVDQSFNLMDPTQARRRPSPTRGNTSFSQRLFGATPFEKMHDASPMKESEEYFEKRGRIRRLQHNIGCLLLIIAVLTAATIASFKLMSRDGTPEPLGNGGEETPTSIEPDISATNEEKDLQQEEEAEIKVNPERLKAISAKLVASGATAKLTLATDGTAQNKALDWLSNHDPAQLEPTSEYLVPRYVLAVLFYATSGRDPASTTPMKTDWEQHALWMTGEGYCSWYGIKCVGEDDYFHEEGNGKIFEVRLPANNLSGSIPSELLSLSDLFLLNLKSNLLVGTLPRPFLFRNMRDLILDDNMLSGPIEMKMVSMVQLRTLSLSLNDFTGSIPESLGLATQLRYIKLNENELTGTIPTELSSLSKLETFKVGHNHLHGTVPDEFYNMTRLMNVTFSQNSLSGTISPNLSKLSHLEELHLTGNDFSGTIPDSFEKMVLLGVLHLGDNNLSGYIPPTLGSRHRLERLDVTQNDLFGPMPLTICELLQKGRLHHLAADCLVGDTTVLNLNDLVRRHRHRRVAQLAAPNTINEEEEEDGVFTDEDGNTFLATTSQKQVQEYYYAAGTEAEYVHDEEQEQSLEFDQSGVICDCCTFCHIDEETAAKIFNTTAIVEEGDKEEEPAYYYEYDEADCQERLHMSNFRSNEWPGLVGMIGENAKTCLEGNFPNLSVQLILSGEDVPADYIPDRILIYLGEDGLVESPPRIGRRHLRQ